MVTQIRNFAIVAHIDHGKSTLADRMLELTGVVKQAEKQTLDSNPIERERGITIKLAPVRMEYHRHSDPDLSGEESRIGQQNASVDLRDDIVILNLIDTPGHVDFSYEVSRALAACEGAILLVDASQGIQAQTLAHAREAQKLNLKLIPVINKIDLASADVEDTKLQLIETFGFSEEEILLISAKTGEGVEKLLEELIIRVPSPDGDKDAPLRALVFNSQFDAHQGVVAWIKVVDGSLGKGSEISFMGTKAKAQAIEIRHFDLNSKEQTGNLKLETKNCISTGDVGYVVTGLKDPKLVQAGDTLIAVGATQRVAPTPLPGYSPPKPMIFASFYPIDQADFKLLGEALEKLKLLDSSLQFTAESSPLLGNGYRIGFLGLLHAEIVQERLEREFNLSVFASAPNVVYKVRLS